MPWIAGYVLIVLLPLAVAFFADPFPAPRPLPIEASVALGLIATVLGLIQFALVSRLRPGRSVLPTDTLMQFHRQMGITALALATAHPLLFTGYGMPASAWSPFAGSALTRSGAIALWALALIVLSSVGRRRLRLRYETWQAVHLGAALVIVGGSFAHAQLAGGYAATPPLRLLLLAGLALFVVLALRYRLVRPLQMYRRPWEVVANDEAGGGTRLLRVRPVGHAGLTFLPGQFAWLITGRSPLWSQQHPVSIACSAAPQPAGALEFAVKALGDWSGDTVPGLAPGHRLWIDGPFGAFTLQDETDTAPTLVLIAGGIGIAPMRSLLLTLADRGDRRPVHLIYAARDPGRVICGADLDALRARLDLRLVFVFEHPAGDWPGERGRIDERILRRHLPGGFQRYRYFVCGPPAMIEAMEKTLLDMGVPSASINTERFDLV